MKTHTFLFAMAIMSMTACNDKDLPPMENEEEVIDMVRLTFLPSIGDALIYEAVDPDGEGPQSFEIPKITLLSNTTYTLSLDIENTQTGDIITDEIQEEGAEHMFYFDWTEGIFTNPSGNGNVDNRDDPVIYNDQDELSLPIGLKTTWNTADLSPLGAYFRILLKHQPGVKTSSSSATVGETDIDLKWEIEII